MRIYKARRERRVHSKDDLNSLRYSYHFLLGFSQHLLLRDEIIDVPSLFVHLMNVDDDEEESEIKSQIMRILYNNNNKLSHSYLSVVVRIIPITYSLRRKRKKKVNFPALSLKPRAFVVQKAALLLLLVMRMMMMSGVVFIPTTR